MKKFKGWKWIIRKNGKGFWRLRRVYEESGLQLKLDIFPSGEDR